MTRLDRLTQQQEAFVAALVSGKSQREAYFEAYPKSRNWKPESVDSKACTLFKKDKVRARYDQLIREYQDKLRLEAFYDRDQAINDLLWLKEEARDTIQENGLRQASAQAYLNCIKELGNLIDLYPNKVNKTELTVDAVVDNNNPFAELTTEQLLKLAGDYDAEE